MKDQIINYNEKTRHRVFPDGPTVEIVDDTVYSVKVVEQYDDGMKIVQRRPVITKDVFIKCYEEWILNKHTDDGK